MIREKHAVKLTRNFFIFLCLWLGQLCGQELRLPISQAGIQSFRNEIYLFGLSSYHLKTTLLVYRADSTLHINDSVQIPLGKKSKNDYSRIISDTLHGQLQLYLHGTNGLAGQIVRPSNDLKKFELISNIESARMNQMNKFSNQKWICDSSIYDVSHTIDSSGRQFYISKFQRLSAEGNYDYKRVWQFPLEKKDIVDLHIIYVNEKHVYLFVYRKASTGPTQWVVRLSAKHGQFQKASKLVGADKHYFRYAASLPDKKTQELYLVGQTHDLKTLGNTTTSCGIWLCKVDTSGQLVDFKIHKYVQQAAIKNTKTRPEYFLNFSDLNTHENETCEMNIDLFESLQPNCKRYVGSQKIIFDMRAESAEPSSTILSGQAELAFYFNSLDKLDRNAKVCFDADSAYRHITQMVPRSGGKLAVKYNGMIAEAFILTKLDVRKERSTFEILALEKGHYKLKAVCTANFSESATCTIINQRRFFIAKQESPQIVRINLFYW
jgi:hypothetical protein